MNLKKSDKIIASAAVIILIIAAVGVFLYTEQDKDDDILKDKDEYYNYEVKYTVIEGTAAPDNTKFKVKDPVFGSGGGYTDTVEISAQHIKQVCFLIDFKDSRSGLLNQFKDTLTVKILDENGEKVGQDSITGNDNVTISTTDSQPMKIGPITAMDDSDAQEMLEENLSYEMQTYTIKVTLDHGEKIRRPLLWLLEKLGQDDFGLQITYQYYHYYLGEPEETDDGDDKDTSMSQDDEWKYTVYHSTNLPGFH